MATRIHYYSSQLTFKAAQAMNEGSRNAMYVHTVPRDESSFLFNLIIVHPSA